MYLPGGQHSNKPLWHNDMWSNYNFSHVQDAIYYIRISVHPQWFLSHVNQVQGHIPQLRRHAITPDSSVIILKYSLMHAGGGTSGYVAEFPSKAIVQVVVDSPINSKPGSQL